ncbi:glycosyltransferase family 4 protein [Mucilaginibacter ginsenosidivorans]|uniref:Glycosyltransferase family 4 protein n=1 Tax=Mucilaginibacter ginsenosidivorans TaxID=398053 RepID=A0A5B8UW62_9SPHI|nr:glycosyltransferase family 4 protein [Mucilaginibacter ginsenosidivorans]QEC62571.1 glycosyltransferase family 4 protein [Mucilaginibacter ginsenosidivorans]
MRSVVASPTIAPHVRQTVTAYQEAGFLETFYTSFFTHPDYRLAAALSRVPQFGHEIRKRAFHELPIEKIAARPWPELFRSLSARTLGPRTTDRLWEWSELGFDQWVARNLSVRADVVHTYEHAALATLTAAKKMHIFSIYEQPSQHHTCFSQIARKQMVLYPELRNATDDLQVNTHAARRNRRRDAELSMASVVLCNSLFTKNTLIAAGVEAKKIAVIPLAFPEVSAMEKITPATGPLKFLYAGNQSMRKGVHILYQAWRRCNFSESQASLWLIGNMSLPLSLRNGLPGDVLIREHIAHNELMQLYSQADVLVFPTLADGFGMVVTEAMSQGLPVIASTNSCGPDIIEPFYDGWLVPPGEVDALAEHLRWCVGHRDEVAACGRAAKKKAGSYQWPEYRQNLMKLVTKEWTQFR